MRARVFLIVALAAMPAAAQRIASDFEIAQMERQVATSRDFLSQVSGRLNLGDLRLMRNEPALAHSEFTLALDVASAERLRARKASDLARYATATAYEGLADAKLGRAADSMQMFDEALRYASDDAKTWNLYSTAMGTLRRDGKAVALGRNAVALADAAAQREPNVANELDLDVYRYSLATALTDTGSNEEAQRLLATVVQSLRSSRFDELRSDAARAEAFEIYSSARGDRSAYLSLLNRAQLRLGASYEASGDVAAAKKQYENVVAGRSDDVTALGALARLSDGADRDRYYAAAFDANPFATMLIRRYRAYLASGRPEPADASTPGGAMRLALQQLARGERHAARSTLDALAKKFPQNGTIAALQRETEVAAATLPSATPTAEELRRFIDGFELLTAEQRAALDKVTFTSDVVFDVSAAPAQPGQTIFESGTISGVPFRFSEPIAFAGTFDVRSRLTYRILGASGDALLLEPVKVEK